jgi:hypothetical protein
MNIVNLSRFGLNLSGRPLGITAYPIVLKEYEPPYELDFKDVNSIGSSFADEVVAKLAVLNGGQIVIHNSKNVISKCLNDVAKEHKFKLIFKS